jgi:hypothetical protein
MSEPAWKHIVSLFNKYGLEGPPVRLRDELAAWLISHRAACEAAEGPLSNPTSSPDYRALLSDLVEKCEPFVRALDWVGWDALNDKHWIECRPINRSNGPVIVARKFRALAAAAQRVREVG